MGDYRTTVITRRGELALTRDAIKESYQELDEFKAEHRLRRPAHRGILPIYAFSTIGIAWFIESVANTAFLRVNDDAGLVGGFVAAMVVAAVNVFISAFVGRQVLPYMFYRHQPQKTFAYLGGAAWLVLLVVWNLLAGHFRDAKASGMGVPEDVALVLFASGPLQFDSIYSYGLLAAGFIFAILAAIAGYKMDDPYPGYGSIYRRHESRCDTYAVQIEDAMEDLQDIRDDAIDQAQKLREALGLQFRERGQIITARETHRTRYREHQDYLEEQANALLSRYRASNRRARTDGKGPRHFDLRWILNRTELPKIDDEPVVDAEVLRAQEALQESIETISTSYNEAIESFEDLDTIKGSLKNG